MINSINHDQLRRSLLLLWVADIPACIVGSVGTGKTTAVEELVEMVKEKINPEFTLWKVFLGLIDSTDIGGIPHKGEDGKVDYMPPRCLPFGSDQAGIIFGDEYDRAAPDVQNAFNQILLGREIHNNRISDDAYVVLAMNGESDSYTTPLSKAARNRVCTLFLSSEAAGSNEQWDKWARENKVNDTIRGFAKYRSDLIVDEANYSELALITPRSRDMAGKILDASKTVEFETEDILLPCLAGVIGTAAANELLAYISLENDLPDIKKLLNDPEEYQEYMDRPDITYMLGIAIAKLVEQDKGYSEKAINLFNNRFPPEIQMWAVDNIVNSNPDVVTTPEYIRFFNETKNLI